MNTTKLAIHGGTPAVTTIGKHYEWPILTERTQAAVLAQMQQGVCSLYNRSGIFRTFEDRWSDYHDAKHALVTSSGTAGLWSAYHGINLGEGDEVLVPAYTFYATATPLLFTGATPVLVDCDSSGNIDPLMLEAARTGKTRAVAVTHMWGNPCPMAAIKSFCERFGLALVEDCSHAHGARLHGQPVGTFGNVGVWSLQGQKIVTGGEGGILVTSDDDVYARAQLLGQYNKRCLQEIDKGHPLYRYSVTGAGMKLRAHPWAIAAANEQFDHLEEWLAVKRIYAARMTERLSGLPGLRTPVIQPGAEPAWYAYVLRYCPEELGGLPIEEFANALWKEGASEVDLPRSTAPLNTLPLFQDPGPMYPRYTGKMAYREGQFPMAERFFRSALKLPVWVNPVDGHLVEQYCDAIEKVCRAFAS